MNKKQSILSIALAIMTSVSLNAQDMSRGADNFYESTQLIKEKARFDNIYNMEVVGNLYKPKDMSDGEKLPAIIVGHPMGAVKEQSANLYAQKMAERGFVTIAIDLSYWGESEGEPRNSVLPDIYAEDFSAAADYLGSLDFVDRNNIGVIGVCGSGGFSLSAAKVDSRLKAIATVSMYDMGGFTRNMYGHMLTKEQRKAAVAQASQARWDKVDGKETIKVGGTSLEISEDAHPIAKEFYDFYRTPRGHYVPEGASEQTITRPTQISNVKFMNFYPFNDLDTISPRPVLFIAGEHAHSLEWSQEAYNLAAEPKELYLVPDAGHVDLYDRTEVIPFDKLEEFFKKNLTQ